MTFRAGMKVVCINDEEQHCKRGDTRAVKGEIYTVRECFDWFGVLGLRFVGITNPNDRGYYASRFRPIVEKKTDISIFTAMLTPKKQRERA